MRDHEPVPIAEFKGLWARGDAETCPLDHSHDCENFMSVPGGFQTRPDLEFFPVGPPLNTIPNIKRVYTYNRIFGQGMLVLDDSGRIYDTLSPTPTTPILTIAA